MSRHPPAPKRSTTGCLVRSAHADRPTSTDELPGLPDPVLDADIPEDLFTGCSLDGPLEGPGGRPARVRSGKQKVTYPGRSMVEIMESLEMVPHRQHLLWGVSVPPALDGSLQDDLVEVYSPPRMVLVAKKAGLRADLSIDLLTGWNLLDQDRRVQVVQQIKARRPKVLMMSPPCTWFSGLMNLNWNKIGPVVREQAFRDATLHLEFCMLLADLQESEGRGWALEHPDTAKSWNNAKVRMVSSHGALMSRFDQCMFGLVSKVDKIPMRKRTRFMSNLQPLHASFHGKFCDKQHPHVAVIGAEGGEKRSVWAQRYPPALCEQAVNAFSRHCHAAPGACR